ncbi:MAG: FAD-dependent oxidoreductase [Burkholderiaceae bacterium]|nr:FAD-dependent oxidoreductase [Burkholderiaceae bacterium]
MKVAVVGAGIAGLSCAYTLVKAGVDVTLLESGDYFGGHSHTVDVTLDGKTFGVDTGFLVFNHRTYPNLVRLFAELGVETSASDMSFSVKTPVTGRFGRRLLEWAGHDLNSVFCQRRNLLDARFLHMLRDIVRFNREASALAADAGSTSVSLGEFLSAGRYGAPFRNWYLLPMAGCIWSCPVEQMLAFPIATFARFCANHGLLQIDDRPQWHTVTGGSRNYVNRMLAAIEHKRCGVAVQSVSRTTAGGQRMIALRTADGVEYFDQVVLACHSDQSLGLLADAKAEERQILGAIAYQANRAVLHTDTSCLPRARRAWAAWNYQSEGEAESRVCVHYLINRLQPLPVSTPVIVSLNPLTAPAPESIIAEFDYAHPVFDSKAVAAQVQLGRIQGYDGIWFAGAWSGYGFHEDGLKSGLGVAQGLLDMRHRMAIPSAA